LGKQLEKSALKKASSILRAVAHPIRLAIIDTLSGGECTVGHIAATTGTPQALTSQQLKILRDHDILASRRDGNRVFYRINNPAVLKVLACLRRNNLIA